MVPWLSLRPMAPLPWGGWAGEPAPWEKQLSLWGCTSKRQLCRALAEDPEVGQAVFTLVLGGLTTLLGHVPPANLLHE